MKLQKHERESLAAVRKMWPGMKAQLHAGGKHPKLIARIGDLQVRVTVASSPSCAATVPDHTVRLIRRGFAALGVNVPQAA